MKNSVMEQIVTFKRKILKKNFCAKITQIPLRWYKDFLYRDKNLYVRQKSKVVTIRVSRS